MYLQHLLSGRSATAGSIKVSGNMHVAGRKINPVQFRERIAYVMQVPFNTPIQSTAYVTSFHSLVD